ncbi:hypothetical protein FB45DRAFT_872402 [Roridomyces roridus]|uniref:Integrase core domain-containing protein n=1 Tax=Roridomyces roridus TaxID=1738132 RepID=A0AAD7FGW0_9AGAR|nr:hypothetical protein FB45DRAFT_872402 [Roridomyces roridus]
MPNPTGKNGHPSQDPPDDEKLREALLKYARQGLSREHQISALASNFKYHIRLSSLRKLKERLGIKASVRTQKLSVDQVRQAVVDVVERDPAQLRGPAFIKDQLRLKMLFAPRNSAEKSASDLIRQIMVEHYPGGFEVRFPGRKNRRVIRVPLRASGPYYEISSDGHEKLAPAALRMGGVGFSIYAFKDKFTDALVFIKVLPDIRSAGAGGHIFLDFVEHTGFIPIQLTTDKGSEVGWIYAFMAALREMYAPDIDPALYPFHVLIKSVHNTVIEGFWRHLKEKLGLNLKDYLLRGRAEHLFNPHDPLHEPLFYWIFSPLIQRELDDFADWWNNHRVRHQHDKIMPSGHVPSHAMEYPELFGALDCRIKVPQVAIDALRDQISGEEGPKSQFQSWPGLTAEFDVYACRVYEEIGEPTLTMETGWDVFVNMTVAMTVA